MIVIPSLISDTNFNISFRPSEISFSGFSSFDVGDSVALPPPKVSLPNPENKMGARLPIAKANPAFNESFNDGNAFDIPLIESPNASIAAPSALRLSVIGLSSFSSSVSSLGIPSAYSSKASAKASKLLVACS